MLYENVHGHECGVGKQPCINSLIALVTYDFACHIVVVIIVTHRDAKLLACLVLERGGAHQFAYAHVHVEQQVKFRNLGHIALHKNCGFVGVEPGCKVFGHNMAHVAVKQSRVGLSGEGMQVGYKEKTVVDAFLLHSNEFLQRAQVVTEVQLARGTYAAEYYFFHNQKCR